MYFNAGATKIEYHFTPKQINAIAVQWIGREGRREGYGIEDVTMNVKKGAEFDNLVNFDLQVFIANKIYHHVYELMSLFI